MDLTGVPTEEMVLELRKRGYATPEKRKNKPRVKPELTHKTLLEKLFYDPESGLFYSRLKLGLDGNPAKVGHINQKGYAFVSVNGWPYQAHRLAWFYVHQQWPSHEVDHINGDRSDNRICNLRDVTKKQNQENRKSFVGKSGIRGVCWSKHAKKWKAYVKHNQKLHNLGFFVCKEEAGAAAAAARDKLFTHHQTKSQ